MANIPDAVVVELEALSGRFGLERECREAIRALLKQAASHNNQTLIPDLLDSSSNTFIFNDGDAPAPAIPAPPASRRYQDLGPLGRGGIGEVRRVYDPRLARTVALKRLRLDRVGDEGLREQFIEEARLTGQLSHPGIVAVHELGHTPDSRPYFTMKEIQGRTLESVIAEVHVASRGGAWGTGGSGWTFRRLIDALHRSCEAVSFAHSQGIIHRDLKPDNIMVGAFGEVYVVDWGLAMSLVAGPADRIIGTPAYMPPEQAAGDRTAQQPTADVYALGGILFAILSGHPPIQESDTRRLIERAVAGERDALPDTLPIPDVLRTLCEQALSPRLEDRPTDAGALVTALAAWLEGEQHRQRARALIEQADALAPEIHRMRTEAAALRAEAAALLHGVPGSANIHDKRPGWEREDAAAGLEEQASAWELVYTQSLHTALNHAPDFPAARTRLAQHYHRAHAAAEAAGDRTASSRMEAMLRVHDQGEFAGWLSGTGRLTLRTDHPGVVAHLYRYRVQDRQCIPVSLHSLGPTPIRELSLPIGSYLITLHSPGRPLVRYPVCITRQVHTDSGVIPIPEVLSEDEVYVPAGAFLCGGDPSARLSLPRQSVQLGAFVIERFPVTNLRYLAFLNHLWHHGAQDAAMRHVPRERAGISGEAGTPCYAIRDDGFSLTRDGEGDSWLPTYPVVNIDWHSATAFAVWRAEQTGQPWRLPDEREWEKAARGVDGRSWPWGDRFDATFCCVLESHAARPLPSVVTGFPIDESPYGVRGMAGNVADWCANAWSPDQVGPGLPSDAAGEMRSCRGGWWVGSPDNSRAAMRNRDASEFRDAILGFRLVRSVADRVS
ncbi:MAG: sulfatase activating formylglycine-generating enzyme [Myxococcota bacterium]|jgi:formylglycine-generating enzyme required for sulfatase activity/tRNA A-37 threonylcarbamoyl transferase component Bud32